MVNIGPQSYINCTISKVFYSIFSWNDRVFMSVKKSKPYF